ncbi:hypothetical protein E1B28_007460 [Marasmius oreades]|uniref:Uncharacterized protein n=1 Tax=Marasmius oreades TaxID=181124 RepID=A0A9P7S1L5_9AGAR|nr:uncharacterized protein E1B28_007460 [Marasmius oreades]KAG7093819.1 hypothetical protein E1B28_007460 [Marasmius oreades]
MPLPGTFNPFDTHPFTNYTSSSPLAMNSPPSALPTPTPTRPMPVAKSAQQPIFVLFRQGAATPDLDDILKKKPGASPPSSMSSSPSKTSR